MAFSVGISVKEIRGKFLEPAELMSAVDRAKFKGARQFGAFTRSVARRSMRKGGREATFAEFDPDLAKLVFGSEAKQGRNAAGQFLSYADVDLRPWPIVGAKPGDPPKYRSRTLRDNIFFVVDKNARSVVTGPTSTKYGGVPELLEYGGQAYEAARQWVEFWEGNRRLIRLATKPGSRVTLKPRPYMAPAYETALDRLVPDVWENSIR